MQRYEIGFRFGLISNLVVGLLLLTQPRVELKFALLLIITMENREFMFRNTKPKTN